MNQPATLSVCLIVRNEAHQIRAALDAVRSFADEIIVVDTGSVDATRAVAGEFTPHVFSVPWRDDFAEARNASFERATSDYILWIDADDRVDEENARKLVGLKNYLNGDKAFYFVLKDIRNGKLSHSFLQLRCVPNRPDIRFQGRIHERLDLSVRHLGITSARTDIAIFHHGYDDPAQLQAKISRNIRILEKELAAGRDDAQILYYLALSYDYLDQKAAALEVMERSVEQIQRNIQRLPASDRPGYVPFLMDGYLFMAEHLSSSEQRSLALRCLTRAAALPDPSAWALFRLGCMWQRLQKHRDALLVFHQIELGRPSFSTLPTPDLEPDTLMVHKAYSVLCLEDSRTAEHYLGSATARISKAAAWEGIGLLALQDNRLGTARNCLELAMQQGDLSADGWANWGLIQKRQGDLQQATAGYRKALDREPTHVSALANLAHLQLQRNNLVEAKQHFLRLRELGEADLDSLLALAFLASREGNREQVGEIRDAIYALPRVAFLNGSGQPSNFQQLAQWLHGHGSPTLARWARELALREG